MNRFRVHGSDLWQCSVVSDQLSVRIIIISAVLCYILMQIDGKQVCDMWSKFKRTGKDIGVIAITSIYTFAVSDWNQA